MDAGATDLLVMLAMLRTLPVIGVQSFVLYDMLCFSFGDRRVSFSALATPVMQRCQPQPSCWYVASTVRPRRLFE